LAEAGATISPTGGQTGDFLDRAEAATTNGKQLNNDKMAGIFEQSRSGGTLCKLEKP
jgi:hypothetical protein